MKTLDVIIGLPPMFDRIDAVFKVAGKEVIFAWNDRIYNPMNVVVTKELQAHEQIHCARHGGSEASTAEWWEQYLGSTRFRLEEELPAHVAEYRAFCRRHGGQKARVDALEIIARKLAHPLYGSLISEADARDAIMTRVLP